MVRVTGHNRRAETRKDHARFFLRYALTLRHACGSWGPLVASNHRTGTDVNRSPTGRRAKVPCGPLWLSDDPVRPMGRSLSGCLFREARKQKASEIRGAPSPSDGCDGPHQVHPKQTTRDGHQKEIAGLRWSSEPSFTFVLHVLRESRGAHRYDLTVGFDVVGTPNGRD